MSVLQNLYKYSIVIVLNAELSTVSKDLCKIKGDSL